MSALGMVGIVRIGSTTPARFIFRLVQSVLGKDFAQHFSLEIPPRFQGMTVTSWQTFNAKMEEVKSAVLAWGRH